MKNAFGARLQFAFQMLVLLAMFISCGKSTGQGNLRRSDTPYPNPGSQTGGGTVRFIWDPNSEADLAGYRFYIGPQPGVYTNNFDAGLNITYAVQPPPAGTTMYASVTAYNTAGVESLPSNEVAYTSADAPSTGPRAPGGVVVGK